MKILTVILHTAVLPELEAFYRNTLNLKVKGIDPYQFEIHTLGTTLLFKQAGTCTTPLYHFAFNIPSNKIMDARGWLEKRVSLLWMEEYNSYIADFNTWRAQSVYFKDPAGNIVEFIARQDLHDESPGDFDPVQIKNISEIGLVFPVETFEEQVKTFMESYPLVYFDKQPPLKYFRAIGNDEGLFIAVPAQRPWFPTKDIISGIFPLSIDFEVNGNFFQVVL